MSGPDLREGHRGLDALIDRVQGVLLGLAAGDDNGGPVEMAVLLAQSLLHCRPQYSALDVGARYLAWCKDPANQHVTWDTGPTAASILKWTKEASELPARAAKLHAHLNGQTAGVNAVHRVTPLAMAPWLDEEQLQVSAWEESGLTHHHNLSRACCAVLALLCRRLLLGDGWRESLARAAALPQLAPGHLAPVRAELAAAASLAERCCAESDSASGAAPDGQGLEHLDNGGFCVKALGAALHFAIRAASFDEGVRESKAFAGPDNYCPVLVGALLGAHFGASQVTLKTETVSHSVDQHGALLANVCGAAEGLAAAWREAAEPAAAALHAS